MKEISVTVGKTYAVTTAGSCTVTDADGRELCTAESGSQSYFTANGRTVTISDDSASVTQATFNYALAALGLLGGGDKLPKGYTRLEFLESTGSQEINTGLPAKNITVRIKHRPFANAGGHGRPVFFCETYETVDGKGYFNYMYASAQANNKGTGYVAIIRYREQYANATFFDLPFGLLTEGEVNLEDLYVKCIVEGKGSKSAAIPSSFRDKDFGYLRLFTYKNAYIGYIYSFSANYDGIPAANYIPALDSTGGHQTIRCRC